MTAGLAAEHANGAPSSMRGSSSLHALVTIARGLGRFLSVPELMRDNRLSDGEISSAALLKCASRAGLKGRVVRLNWDALGGIEKSFPIMIRMKDGGSMLLTRLIQDKSGQFAEVQDPTIEDGGSLFLDRRMFEETWTGEVVLFRRRISITDQNQPFGFFLIVSLVLREWKISRDILVAALIMGLLALAPVMFWRLLADRVVQFRSLSSFFVICLTMAVLIGVETAISALRRHLLLVLGTRIKIKLSTYVFDRTLGLPIDYFERTPAGWTLHQMRMLERVNLFLTGPLFGTILDSLVLLFFIPVMFLLSPLMTAFTMAVFALIPIWGLAMLPTYRRVSGAKEAANAMRGVFLSETLQGIRTIKSLAIESKQRHEWDARTARATRLAYKEGAVANTIQTVVAPLERLIVSGSLAFGVYLVLVNQSTIFIGTLFAFMMICQRMGAPLGQVAPLIQQFDEARIALRQVADLVNRQPEAGRDGRGSRVPLKGHVAFEAVTFNYKGSDRPALNAISFEVPRGTTIGVMGRSGSGKTTITRLLQCLHTEYEGSIKIDDIDVRDYDLGHLRGSLGVVLQENFLFSGTIRDNITAAKSDATYNDMVMAARMSGAEEFIDKLPKGYETFVYEGSPNLSGGQRQRLAIARALITNPRILILDEATSALDAESEAVVNANIDRIASGRTVITISHRLASLVKSDAIMVMDAGRINDIGTHEELLARNDIYSGLWWTQNSHTASPPPRVRPNLAFRGPNASA